MYQTRGYPIDFELRRAHRARRPRSRTHAALRALATRLRPKRPHPNQHKRQNQP
jgi:hypothetical protein